MLFRAAGRMREILREDQNSREQIACFNGRFRFLRQAPYPGCTLPPLRDRIGSWLPVRISQPVGCGAVAFADEYPKTDPGDSERISGVLRCRKRGSNPHDLTVSRF